MARVKMAPVVLFLTVALMLLANQHARRPLQFRDRRPTTEETWGFATEVAASAVTSASEVVNAAANYIPSFSGDGAPAVDAIQSAIAGFQALQTDVQPAPQPAGDVVALARARAIAAGAPDKSTALKRFTTDTVAKVVVEATDSAAATPASAAPIAASAAPIAVSAAPVAASATAAPESAALAVASCNRDHSKTLSMEDVLCRVPRGETAFISMANAAYGEMAINWALLLLPILARVGHEQRAVIAAMDLAGVKMFLGRRLPTLATSSFGGIKFNAKMDGMDGFRWQVSTHLT
jgi:hypothetical protein